MTKKLATTPRPEPIPGKKLPGMPTPQPEPQHIQMRAVSLPLFSRALKALGKLPHDDVHELIQELLSAPTVNVSPPGKESPND